MTLINNIPNEGEEEREDHGVQRPGSFLSQLNAIRVRKTAARAGRENR